MAARRAVLRSLSAGATTLPLFVVAAVAVIGLLATAASGAGSSSGASHSSATPAITYYTPSSPGQLKTGEVLFEQNCSSCHGQEAEGSSVAPNLRGLGAGVVDFWVSTGRMPLATADVEAVRKPPRFSRSQTLAIAGFVASIRPGGLGIPTPNLHTAVLSEGQSDFVLNCAACHTITGSGDAIASGAQAPSLHKATATQIVEAMRSGPGNMPRFGPNQLSDQQVASVVAYVREYIQHPDNAGGLGLGGIGPVAEGFVALLIGVGGLMLVTFWLGERAK